MGKKRRKQYWWILGVLIVLLAAGGVAILLAPEPPRHELRLAREVLNTAQKAQAEVYAPSVYDEARQLYDSAMVNWSRQNERFFLNRDFSQVQQFALLSSEKAAEAAAHSVHQVKNTNSQVKNSIAELGKQVLHYERVYKKLPLSRSVINEHNKGKMKLAEAKIAVESGRYKEAKAHCQQAEKLIKSSNERAESLLKAWFAHYPQWKKDGAEAIRLSKGGQKVILVDKLAHQCVVYQNGKAIRQFEAELGINWMGDKRRKGDKATPEGIYRVTQKKEGARTKFHRALLLNFPNDDDKRRFAAGKKDGSLPAGAAIGGLIEIHGHGGKGVDWTDGCIALTNENMDALFRLVAVGTPVIIVGSLKPLREIY